MILTSGQLQTKTALDYATRNSYSVTVSVRDSKDDEGNPDTAIDTTTTVTINVTTTTTATATATATATTSSGSRRRRRRPRPLCPNTDTNANTEPNAYGDTNPNRTAVLRPDCRGAQHDRHGGS